MADAGLLRPGQVYYGSQLARALQGRASVPRTLRPLLPEGRFALQLGEGAGEIADALRSHNFRPRRSFCGQALDQSLLREVF